MSDGLRDPEILVHDVDLFIYYFSIYLCISVFLSMRQINNPTLTDMDSEDGEI